MSRKPGSGLCYGIVKNRYLPRHGLTFLWSCPRPHRVLIETIPAVSWKLVMDHVSLDTGLESTVKQAYSILDRQSCPEDYTKP